MVSMRPSGFACTRKVAIHASQMIRFFVFKSSWMRTKKLPRIPFLLLLNHVARDVMRIVRDEWGEAFCL